MASYLKLHDLQGKPVYMAANAIESITPYTMDGGTATIITSSGTSYNVKVKFQELVDRLREMDMFSAVAV